MNKINWENGTLVSKAKVNVGGTVYDVEPAVYSGSTPISAENLNQMETNIENAINNLKPVELFYDSTASYLSATLNDNITNYDIITVIGQSTDGHHCSTTIYKPYNGAKISLCAPQNSGTDSYNKYAVYEFTSTTVIQSNKNFQIANNNISNGNYIKLKSVIGYK